MRKKFVEEFHWIGEQEMMDLTAIAQASPGAIAVNASILVGYHAAGIPGAMVTVLGTVLPPLLIISAISMFYTAFRDSMIVNIFMEGMLAGVAAVICDVVMTMGGAVIKQRRTLPLLMLMVSFLAVRYWNINIIIIILVCGAVGATDMWLRGKRKEGRKQL